MDPQPRSPYSRRSVASRTRLRAYVAVSSGRTTPRETARERIPTWIFFSSTSFLFLRPATILRSSRTASNGESTKVPDRRLSYKNCCSVSASSGLVSKMVPKKYQRLLLDMSNEGNKGRPSAITLGFSTLTHFLLVAPVIYILVIAFDNYSFFSWHPICMSVGVGLLVAEAVFSVSGEAFIAWKLPRRSRVTIHWILHTIGLTLIGIGFIIIIVNKFNHNKHHFATTHSQLGLTTIILSVLTACFGILANNTVWIYPHVRPVLIKVAHACGGIFMTILLLATLINGTYSHWWSGTNTGRNLTFASLFFAGVLILVKPILGAISRCRVIFGPPSSET